VKTNNLANSAVSYEKMQPDSVRSANIKNNSVTSHKIADLAVGDGKISSMSGTKIADGSISLAKLANGVMSGANLMPNSVTTTELAPVSITESELADDSVTNPKITDGAVDGQKITNGVIKKNHLSLTPPSVAEGTVTADLFGDFTIHPMYYAAQMGIIPANTGTPAHVGSTVSTFGETKGWYGFTLFAKVLLTAAAIADPSYNQGTGPLLFEVLDRLPGPYTLEPIPYDFDGSEAAGDKFTDYPDWQQSIIVGSSFTISRLNGDRTSSGSIMYVRSFGLNPKRGYALAIHAGDAQKELVSCSGTFALNSPMVIEMEIPMRIPTPVASEAPPTFDDSIRVMTPGGARQGESVTFTLVKEADGWTLVNGKADT
jgi:hypothetical protein